MIKKVFGTLRQINWSEFAVSIKPCLVCGGNLQVKLFNDEMGVRCVRCQATAVTQSLVQVLKPWLDSKVPKARVYEMSSRGALVRYLISTGHDITLSEFFEDIPVGQSKHGIICQDVQNLTFNDCEFDACTSQEVFEHVEDDIKGFKEMLRVLKPNGVLIFSVPLSLHTKTVERTAVKDGKRVNVLPEVYHTDNLRGVNQVFCYRDYGSDILQKLARVGFVDCQLKQPAEDELFGFGRPIIMCHKPSKL